MCSVLTSSPLCQGLGYPFLTIVRLVGELLQLLFRVRCAWRFMRPSPFICDSCFIPGGYISCPVVTSQLTCCVGGGACCACVSCVCFHIGSFLLPVDIHHTPCPCRFSNPRETQALWSQDRQSYIYQQLWEKKQCVCFYYLLLSVWFRGLCMFCSLPSTIYLHCIANSACGCEHRAFTRYFVRVTIHH